MNCFDFAIVLLCCATTMLICRVVPALALKGRELPPSLTAALELIPPAAFAALVANDLIDLAALEVGTAGLVGQSFTLAGLLAFWPFALPLISSILVIVVARKTKSLTWCIIAGVGCYAVLMLLPL
ncbi:MAG: AzlD domain-containing protein [Coriobacteriales bacterium]|nr:AzlD domain-containing protein [Coriobacteriales bacterium]